MTDRLITDYELLARKSDAYTYKTSDNGRIFGEVTLCDAYGTSLWVFVPTEPYAQLRVDASEDIR
jgi:hypothetical protein